MPQLNPSTKRDPEASKTAILVAATSEFAEHGFAGARIDRIADRAGVNKRMLYYYFGNKDDLFLAVLELTYVKIRSEEQKLHMSEVEPVEAIRRLVSFTWNYYLQNPEFIPLLNSENLLQAKHLKQSDKIRTLHSPFVLMLEEVLDRGQQEGVFRNDTDPVQLYISIAGLTYFYLSNQYTLSTIFDRNLKSQRSLAERLSHVTEVVLGYLIKA